MGECKYGLTAREVVDRINRVDSTFGVVNFIAWMRVQTVAACTGKVYNNRINNYVPDDCGPHGIVYDPDDINDYLS